MKFLCLCGLICYAQPTLVQSEIGAAFRCNYNIPTNYKAFYLRIENTTTDHKIIYLVGKYNNSDFCSIPFNISTEFIIPTNGSRLPCGVSTNSEGGYILTISTVSIYNVITYKDTTFKIKCLFDQPPHIIISTQIQVTGGLTTEKAILSRTETLEIDVISYVTNAPTKVVRLGDIIVIRLKLKLRKFKGGATGLRIVQSTSSVSADPGNIIYFFRKDQSGCTDDIPDILGSGLGFDKSNTTVDGYYVTDSPPFRAYLHTAGGPIIYEIEMTFCYENNNEHCDQGCQPSQNRTKRSLEDAPTQWEVIILRVLKQGDEGWDTLTGEVSQTTPDKCSKQSVWIGTFQQIVIAALAVSLLTSLVIHVCSCIKCKKNRSHVVSAGKVMCST